MRDSEPATEGASTSKSGTEGSQRRWIRRLSIPGLVLLAGFCAAAFAAAPYPVTMCPADRLATDLNCTANDVEVASVDVLNGVTTCVAGDPVSLHLQANIHANSQRRYNVGIFMAQDGKTGLLTSANGGSAVCSTFGLPIQTSPPSPFADLDGNVCGDFDNSVLPSQAPPYPLDLGTVTVTCTPDASGYLDIPTVVTWMTNANTAGCAAPPAAYFVPEGKSKCEAGISQRIQVQVFGKIVVTKATNPAGAAASFSYTASGPSAAPTSFSLSDGQSQTVVTAALGAAAQNYVITEQPLAGWTPGAQIVCKDIDGDIAPFVDVNNATGTITAHMSVSADQAFCTFTNTQQASITINKATLGGDGSFNFSGSPNITPFSITTSGGAGQQTITGLNAGTYSFSESVPAGWDLTGLSCVDPTNDTTVSLANGTATIALAPGENVTCTYTDTKRASITVVKNTVGGDGTFSFGSPAGAFQISTSGGTGQVVLGNLVPGSYSVTESVPAGWDLTNLACVDPSGGTTTAGPTASIGLAAGENVTCTFTDTRRGAIVVRKQVLGTDATFNFTGSQAFSIATQGGAGEDNSTFASIAPGTYTITESALAHYSLTGLTCADPTNDSTTNLGTLTATVNVAAGETVICTFTNTQLATLTIIKQAVPQIAAPNTPSFPFTTTGLAPASFSLADDGTNPNSTTFSDVTPGGAYTVTEGAVSNWLLTAITCTDATDPNPANRSVVDLANRRVTPSLQPGETLRCVFTNVRNDNGAITITKRTIGALAAGTGGTFNFTNDQGVSGSPTNPATFAITTTVTNPQGAQSLTGLAGNVTYTITETPLAGWDLDQSIQCTTTNGSSSTFAPRTNGVAITLGITGGLVDGVACTFVNTHEAGITIVKSATPKDAQSFAFQTNGGLAPAAFTLVDNGTPTPPNTQAFTGLAPGAYTITEQSTTGWVLSSIACSGGADVTTDAATGVASINLLAGESVTCTYNNAKNGTVTIHKVATGGTGGELFAFTGPTALTGSIPSGGQLSGSFAAGTYSASEIVPAGWDLTNITCTGGTVTITGATANPTNGFEAGDTTVNITLASGEAADCTFTNTRRGSLTIVKNTVGGDGSFAFTGAQDFQIQTASGTGQNTTAFASVAPGSYAVTETVPTGWNLTALTCSNGSTTSLANATASVTIAAGESVVCTFTDTKLGSIRIVKRIESDQTTAFPFNVPATMDASGTFTLTPTVQATEASRQFDNLAPGSYAITETNPAGWTLVGLTCVDPSADSTTSVANATATVNLAAGETVECTFVDTQLSTITISVVSVGGAGTFAFNSSNLGANAFSLTTSGDGVKSSQVFANLPPGTYASTGQGASGWQFTSLTCLAESGETYWTIAAQNAGITLPHGENIECTYVYTLAPVVPVTPTPVMRPGLYAFVAFMLMLLAAAALRTRRSG